MTFPRDSGALEVERDLVAAIVARDPRAVAAFYSTHGDLVLSTMARVLPDGHDVEDASREFLFRCVDPSGPLVARWTGRGRLAAFVAVCARNVALDRYRRSRRDPARPRRGRGGNPSEGDPFERLIAPGLDPLDARVRREVVQRVRQALDGLPPRERSVLEMRYFEGLSAEEIAGRLGTTRNNVYQLVHRGESHLRLALDRPPFREPSPGGRPAGPGRRQGET